MKSEVTDCALVEPPNYARLPHPDSDEAAHHVTFRLADSLMQSVRETWTENTSPVDERERASDLIGTELELDAGYGRYLLSDPEHAQVVRRALLYFDGNRYHLHEWVVMPNHVHALLTPLPGHSLASIVHSWKSYTAKELNRPSGRSGTVWLPGYYNRIVRDAKQFANTVRYIRDNPVMAGLVSAPEAHAFSSASSTAG